MKTRDTSIGTGKLSFLTIVILILGVYLIAPLPKGHLQGNYSQVILGSDSSFLRVFLNEDEQWCLPPKLQSGIPDKLVKSVLTYEDEYFQYHPGVNPLALLRALYVNLKNRRIVSGGSTITMQLARMVQNNPRNIWYKLKEMLFAFKLELAYSKKEILSQYLCHAPYGSNIRGYIAASYRYFGKSPGRLTWAEAATLAVLPNAPGIVFPTKNDERLKSKRDSLLLKLMKQEVIDRETFELSLLEKLPAQIIPFPLKAPHLTNRIRSENHLDIVRTTIDPKIQDETDFFLKQHAAGLQQMGIMNACALVIDNNSGKVVSYVGSQGFNDLEHQGRVDGIMAPRSSGSILKPYLYASAIDEGLILPQTLIRDVPTYFNSFSPSNASEKFSGISRASTALVHSLNVPAVRLLNAYGVQRFYHQLKAAGVSTLFRHADDYGLPIILGGAEVNPWDIGKLYSGMANVGVFRNISYLSNMEDGNPSQLVSSGACFLVLEELKELIRPGLEFYWKKYGNQRQIAWKTGTSYGHKDAWAIGCTPQWTIVVWVGNFDGTPNKSLSGMRSAGPLMFNILNALPEERSKPWFKANPHDFVKVKLCRQTGFYPSDNCTDKIQVQAPKKMRPLKTCQYHQKYVIDPLEHHAVCSYCWSGDRMEQYVLRYPPDVNYYLRKNGKVVEKDPVHNPDCKIAQERDILQIIYPLQQANIFIPKDFDGNYQPLVSRLATHFPDRTVFWYLDDNYLGSTKDKSTLPLHLNAGEHTLTVVDVMGNRDQVDFSVILN